MNKLKVVSKVLLIAATLIFLGIGMSAFFQRGGDDLSREINMLAEKGRNLPTETDERKDFVGVMVGEYLAIAAKSKDASIKAPALLAAAILSLDEYEREQDEYERGKVQFSFLKPDSSRINSAITYLRGAAKVCPPGSEGCYAGSIQENLDYAAGLLRELTKEKLKSPEIESAKKEGEKAGSGSDNKNSSPQDPLSGELPQGQNDLGEKEFSRQDPFKGSVRGKISNDPDPLDDPLSLLGGGYKENENRP